VVVFNYKTITRHLPPLGATASVELLSLTDLTFSSDFLTPTLEKTIQISLLAVSYVWTIVKQNKSQVSRRPSCPKTTKGSLQSVSWTCFLRSRKPWVLFMTLLLESQTSHQNDQFPPSYNETLEDSYSMRGPMYNLTSRESNLTQRLQAIAEIKTLTT